MIRFLKIATFSTLFIAACIANAEAANPPRLIINITLGSMDAEALNRCANNFNGGIHKLLVEGAVFTDAR